MCVIASVPAKKILTKDQVKRMWDRNPDGAGFSYIHPNGELKTYKTMDFGQYWATFHGAQCEFGDLSDFLMHLRIATHGTTDLSNVHPFRVDEHTVMAHNGIISKVPHKKGEKRSDTRVFVEDYLPTLPPTWLDNRFIVEMVEDFIGHSKLMFLTTNPELKKEIYILNAHMGTKRDGIWYSNSFSLESPTTSGKYGSAWWNDYEYGSDWKHWSQKEDATPSLAKTTKAVTKLSPPYSLERAAKVEDDRYTVLGIDHEITWSNTAKKFICTGCFGAVKEDSFGECLCFDKVCTVCLQFTCACTDDCFMNDSKRQVLMPEDFRFKRILEERDIDLDKVMGYGNYYSECEVL